MQLIFAFSKFEKWQIWWQKIRRIDWVKLVVLRKIRNHIMNDNNQTMDNAQDKNLSGQLYDILL